MVFNSIPFLVFIVLFLPTYFFLKGRARMWFCLLSSYFFYGWWDWRFLGLVMFTTILDYSLGVAIARTTEAAARKRLLLVSVCANLGFLGLFKYFNFFAASFVHVLQSAGMGADWTTLHIILPIGISFYTFQSMSYTIDVYRKEIEPEKDFFRFATFVSLFPQLVAGPIVRAKLFLPQFRENKRFNWDRFMEGLAQILWGFFKKVAIADSIGPFVDQCFRSPGNFGSLQVLIGVILYSFQIYCDFSGYSNIACGLAQMMGFDFPWNFRTPYFSKNFTEFWRRWHISLSSWLRDYLYISLGGNRGGTFNTQRNLMATMLLGGLWHGANWTFVIWGFLHGFYLVAQRFLSAPFGRLARFLRFPAWLEQGIDIAVVYFLTCFAWIFFRANDFTGAVAVIKRIAAIEAFQWSAVTDKFLAIKAFLLILILLAAELINNNGTNLQVLAVRNPWFRAFSYAFLVWLIALFGTFGSKAFIYFQF